MPRKLRKAQDALATLAAAHEVSESTVQELRAALADAGEKHRNTMTSLAACVEEKHTLQQARSETQAALESAQGQNEALRASETALLASERMWKALVSGPQAQYAAFILPPPPPPAAFQKRPADFLAGALDKHLQEMLLPSDQGRIYYWDSEYQLVPASALTPLFAHWREHLMPPAKDQRSDCENRAVDFAAWYHRWSGFESQIGIVVGTHPWAVVDGRLWPHVYNVMVAPDGQVWLLDPAFLPEPKMWVDEAKIHYGAY